MKTLKWSINDEGAASTDSTTQVITTFLGTNPKALPRSFHIMVHKAMDDKTNLTCNVDDQFSVEYNPFIINALLVINHELDHPPSFIDQTTGLALVIKNDEVWCSFVDHTASMNDHCPIVDGSYILQISNGQQNTVLQTSVSDDGYVTLQCDKWFAMLHDTSLLVFNIFKKVTLQHVKSYEINSEFIMPGRNKQYLEIRQNRFWTIHVFNTHVKIHFTL